MVSSPGEGKREERSCDNAGSNISQPEPLRPAAKANPAELRAAAKPANQSAAGARAGPSKTDGTANQVSPTLEIHSLAQVKGY